MSEFRFKRFTIDNTASALKVGTDSILLGSLMSITGQERRLLDIGTGTGVVAIMAAQRLTDAGAVSPVITAIEIDGQSAAEARRNFEGCPWAGMLEARNCALQDFRSEVQYDLIFSNPPYFDESLRNPDPRESRARHTESLSYREVLAFAREHLSPQGRVSLILPAETETAVRRCAAGFDLNTAMVVNIRTTSKKAPRRIVVEFTRSHAPLTQQELIIQDGGTFTEEYRRIAGAFLLYL
ncbi:MAG: tRNA1(Val) (adenine(37)-N6)-methyltransferase [Candidatus Cryptobacteroides sp.]